MRTIYTIGYEGTDIDRFAATLLAVGIEVLVDVRAIPLSRKPGFSKKRLANRMELEGIAYLHLVDLGDPKPGRTAAREGRYDDFVRIYQAHLKQPEPTLSLERLRMLAGSKQSCLMCFERDPRVCHRSLIVDSITHDDFAKFDLYGDLPRRYDDFQRTSRYISKGHAAAE